MPAVVNQEARSWTPLLTPLPHCSTPPVLQKRCSASQTIATGSNSTPPKNLLLALTGETGELCEIFQWMSEADAKDAAMRPETAQAVKDELADVLMYLVRLSTVLGVDLNEAVTNKLALNGQKYPVDKAKSTSKKYDQL